MRNLNEPVVKYYDSLSEQMRYDEALVNLNDNERMLICPQNVFIPMILKRTHGVNTGAITSAVNAGGGVVTFFAANHIVESGGEVVITGTTDYNGTYTASNVTATTFDVTVAYVSSQTGTWTTGINNISFEIFNEKTDALLYTHTTSDYWSISTNSDYDYLYYDASAAFPDNMILGMVYIKLCGWDLSEWYSESFVTRTSTEIATLSRIDFSTDTRIGRLKASFIQSIYINNRFREPEYPRETIGDKKDGLLIPEKLIYQKVYRIMVYATEPIIDALTLLPMYDIFTVRKADGNSMTVQEIQVDDPVWDADSLGVYASLKINIIEETIIKKSTFTPMGCPTTTTRQGTFTTIAGEALDVTFTSPLPSADYSLMIECWDSSNPKEKAWYSFDSPQTADGFTIKTIMAATGTYFAISY